MIGAAKGAEVMGVGEPGKFFESVGLQVTMDALVGVVSSPEPVLGQDGPGHNFGDQGRVVPQGGPELAQALGHLGGLRLTFEFRLELVRGNGIEVEGLQRSAHPQRFLRTHGEGLFRKVFLQGWFRSRVLGRPVQMFKLEGGHDPVNIPEDLVHLLSRFPFNISEGR